MIINNQDHLNELHAFFDGQQNFCINILIGKAGLGKSFVIDRFISDLSSNEETKIIKIAQSEHSFALWCVHKILLDNKCIDNEPFNELVNKISFLGVNSNGSGAYMIYNGMDYKDWLLNSFYKFCDIHTQVIIILDKLQYFSDELLDFFNTVFLVISKRTHNKVMVVAEIDDDNVSPNVKSKDALINFFSLHARYTRYLPFESWNFDSLKTLLFSMFNKNLIIDPDTVSYILKSVFSNPANLLGVIEYLKSENIIYEDKENTICKKFENNVLIQYMGRYVLSRFQTLDVNLRSILLRSSIIGFEFDEKLLENPLQTIRANERLCQIEKISKLIHRKIEAQYEFDSYAAYLSVKDLVSIDEHEKWNEALGEYFEDQSTYLLKDKGIEDTINAQIKAVFYYNECRKYTKVFNVSKRLIPMLMSILHYRQALSYIALVKENAERVGLPPQIVSEYDYLDAECNRHLFNYTRAAELYKEYLKKTNLNEIETYRIKYLYAISLYGSGEVHRPYTMLVDISKKLKKNITQENAGIYVKVLSEICSIDETLQKEELTEHFNEVLGIANKFKLFDDYYELLRKALIAHKGENGVKLMATARDYYRKENNLKEYAMACHNIGIEMLIHSNMEVAKEHFDEGLRILSDVGSLAINYSLNAIAMYYALSKGDFEKAYDIFSDAIDNELVLYSKISLMLNAATCLRKLGKHPECLNILNQVSSMFSLQHASEYNNLKPHLLMGEALLELDSGHLESALNKFENYVKEYPRDSHHRLIFAVKNIINICHTMNIDFPSSIEKYKNAQSESANRYLKYNVTFVRLSFAEN